MYHPTTRLLTVLELLQARGRIDGAELARRLEVDRRSVRRYVMMLQDLGIPIEGIRGAGGGYRLRPGFKLPPLLFTDDEAIAVVLGLIGVAQLGVDLDPTVTEGALAKIERVLPVAARSRVQALRDHIAIGESPAPPVDHTVLVTCGTAIGDRRSLQITYQAYQGEPTERLVNPYRLVAWQRHWYVLGYCHLRRGLRTFRIDRIAELALTDRPFDPPATFDALGYLIEQFALHLGRWQVEVLLDATIEQAERRISAGYALLEPDGDRVLLRCSVDDLDSLARWIVGFGFRFTVRSPAELRDAVSGLGRELLAGMITP